MPDDVRSLRPSDHPLRVQGRVIRALMLRDIRTRFFGHGLGYLIAIAWPLAHIAILLAIYSVSGRATPIGDSLVVFFSTALVPTMTFIYMSRFIMSAGVTNRPLVYFPVVKITDLFFARGILEVLASCCMTIVVMTVLYCCWLDITPVSVTEAGLALAASMLLGLGFGFLNGMIAMAIPFWTTVYGLSMVIFYLTSGVLFMPDALPSKVVYALSWNPVFHGVEWMRTAYFQGYQSGALDKGYLLTCGIAALLLALVLERLIRGKLLGG